LLEKLQRWNKSVDGINSLIPILTSSDLEKVKIEIKKLLDK
jgi:virginiamycin A acetyltransferase